jgi:signal transduction histidine kinase
LRSEQKNLGPVERLAAIGETAGMIGHDIRNPLQAIVSELFLARQVMAEAKDKNTSEALESIDSIQEQVDYISKIVQDLQDYARPLKVEYVDVFVQDLIFKVFKTIPVPDKVKLKIDVRGNMKFKTDATFVMRALTNLVINAVQAMPDGGELSLTAYPKETSVIIAIADTGEGIPEEAKPNLFKPLFTTKSKGQGLGLAVVKRLVESLGGKVSFESEIGKGTKFTVELPVNS